MHRQRNTLQRTKHHELCARLRKSACERENAEESDSGELDGSCPDNVRNGASDEQRSAGREAINGGWPEVE